MPDAASPRGYSIGTPRTPSGQARGGRLPDFPAEPSALKFRPEPPIYCQMTPERRNLYRILYVQPEAPPEVITAVYRCLMTRLRTHPDLGGDHETAARINQAYQILRDPAKRKAYDESRRRPLSARIAPTPGGAARASLGTPRVCPFCALPVPARVEADTRCQRCASPLAPIAYELGTARESFGRRSAPRVAKDCRVTVHTAPNSTPVSAVLRDLSLTGVSLYTAMPVPAGGNIRIETLGMDVVAHVIKVQRHEQAFLVRGTLLTALYNRKSGLFMSTTA